MSLRKPLSSEDIRLIADLKAERARLRLQQQIIRKELEELTDRKIAAKFDCRVYMVQEVCQ